MTFQQTTLRIEGMHCEGCTRRITRVLERLEGVRSAKVALAEERAEITYDADCTGPDAFRAAVEKAGYTPAEDATPANGDRW